MMAHRVAQQAEGPSRFRGRREQGAIAPLRGRVVPWGISRTNGAGQAGLDRRCQAIQAQSRSPGWLSRENSPAAVFPERSREGRPGANRQSSRAWVAVVLARQK